MNFHKKIGFLAALLLMFGLGVPDSFAQDVSGVTFSSNPVITTTEGGDAVSATLTVTVTFDDNFPSGNTQAVTLGLKTGSTMAGTFTPRLPASVNVIGDGDTQATWTGVYVYAPPTQDDGISARTFTLQASSGGQTGDLAVTVNNAGGTTVSLVTLSLNGSNSVAAEEGGDALAITAVVDALVGTDAEAGYTRPVVVSLASGSTLEGTFSPTLPITVTASVTAATLSTTAADTARATTTITYTPAAVDDTETAVGRGTLLANSPFGGQSVANATGTVTEDDINIIQSVSVTLNGSDNISVSEDGSPIGVIIGVSVDLDSERDEGETRDVVVSLASGSTLQGMFSSTLPITVTATVPTGGGTRATGQKVLTYTPQPDADGISTTVTLVPSTAGQDDETTITDATLTVTDNGLSGVTLSLNPDEVKDSAGSTNIAVSVTVNFGTNQTAGDTHDVVVSLASGSTLEGTFSPTLPITVTATVPTGQPTELDTATGSGTVAYTPPGDLDSDDSSFKLVARLKSQTSPAVTFTVDDDDELVGTITITTDVDQIAENVGARDVTVTATLSTPAAAGGVVVSVMTSLVGSEGKATSLPKNTTITIPAGGVVGSATLSIDPADDDIFSTRSIRVTGSAGSKGYASGTKDIVVLDNDSSMGKVVITASPPSVRVGETETQNVTLTVKVVLAEVDTPIPSAVTVNLAVDGSGTLASNSVTVTGIKKTPDKDPATVKAEGSAKVVLSFSATEAATAGTATVTGTASMYDAGSRTIPIRDRDAVDIVGYRAVIVKPTGTNWAKIGNHQVEVDVIRVGNFAYPWTDFQEIRVSLRDTANGAHEIDEVFAANFNNENGTITFTEGGSRGDVVWKGNDIIRFRIKVNAWKNDDPDPNGEYLGAYAHVEFVEYRNPTSSKSHIITNRESDKPVYPANPTIVNEANRYRGDGRLIRIDNKAPANSAIGTIKVTLGDEKSNAVVGDEIRVAVEVSKDVIFRDTGLRIQLKTVDNTGELKGKPLTNAQVAANTIQTVLHPASDIIAAPSDSMFAIWDVTEGFFKVTADDFIPGIGNKGKKFEADYVQAQVFVQIQDLAGNFSGVKTSHKFRVDSRSPGIDVLYPSENPHSAFAHTNSMHFTGARASTVEGKNVAAHLNPLRIVTDERLSKLEIYAAGADTLDISEQMFTSVIGDSNAVYNTSALNSPKRDKKDKTKWIPSSKNIGGTEIDLVILATDILGNVTKETIEDVTHDAASPEIVDWFPQNRLIQDDQINDATRHPVFTLKEDVDSIAVTFSSLSAGASDVKETQDGLSEKGEIQIVVSDDLVKDARYTMTIFLRDLAGNVFITPADSSSNMRFNPDFDNPKADMFKVTTKTDSVVANQANFLTIQAVDKGSPDRNALTYKNRDEDGNTAAEVRISAWDADGGAVTSFCFEGKGVTDDCGNPDGMATLDAGGWVLGKRTVMAKSKMAIDNVKILVEHRNAGAGDTTVPKFNGAIEDLYVGAADFREFMITAEDDVEGVIWGDYTLRVVPVDNYGNPSLRAFKDVKGDVDSLSVLDTRKTDIFEYDEVAVRIVGVPTIEDLALLTLTIPKEGRSFDLVAPSNRRTQIVEVRIVSDEYLDPNDIRSRNINTAERFTISAPLDPKLTLWVPGSDVDEAGNDVVIPADPGRITVTVAAEGYNAGDMVTFTRNGTAMDPVAANDDGVAKLDITASMAGTTTVSATDGRYSTDALTITFVDTPPEPDRKSYVDANGDPVYLIYTGDAPPDMTVGTDDFLALVAAFGSSDGDDNYNAQADVNDDGTVNVADYLEFITSYGRTAAGPATKPLVLLPGINENAEFSLSLGSERVVAGELVAVDVSLANVEALTGYGFALNYETDKFEFVSVAPADEDLLKSTGGETLFHHVVADGQITVANGLYNGTAISGGGDVVRFVFRVLREFEDNARFEIADGLVFDPSQLQNPAVVAGVLELQSTPREFALHQNFPNPFNPDTTIKYDLAESADVTLQIYNVLGQVVRTLVASEAQNAGRYQIRWNGMDDRGVPVSSGIYFYQISADGKFSDVRKLMLLK